MGNVVEMKKHDDGTVTYHFDREKILLAVDFMKMCLQEGERSICKCMCSAECIDEAIRFLEVVKDAWEEVEEDNNGH